MSERVIDAARKMLEAVERLSQPAYDDDHMALSDVLEHAAFELGWIGAHDSADEAFTAIRAASDELRAALDAMEAKPAGLRIGPAYFTRECVEQAADPKILDALAEAIDQKEGSVH